MTVDRLVSMLADLEAGKVECQVETCDYDGDTYVTCDEIRAEASKVLILADGSCNVTNIVALRKHGYDVFPGEEDSFGWLTGCIQTSKGILVYG